MPRYDEHTSYMWQDQQVQHTGLKAPHSQSSNQQTENAAVNSCDVRHDDCDDDGGDDAFHYHDDVSKSAF